GLAARRGWLAPESTPQTLGSLHGRNVAQAAERRPGQREKRHESRGVKFGSHPADTPSEQGGHDGSVCTLLRARSAGGTDTSRRARSLVVDDDRGNCPTATFSRIQDAIDAAFPGEVVHVCAGTYAEQLVVAKPIQIHGVPGARVAPTGMVANTTDAKTGAPIAAIAVVTRNATLDRLEVHPSGRGFRDCSTPARVVGVYFRGTSGSLRRSDVHDIPCADGTGVVVEGVGPLIQVAVLGNFVHDYTQAGVVVSEYGAQAKIDGNTIRGAGNTTDRMQNGIQVVSNAVAKVRRNIVQSNAGPSGSDCLIDSGNLFFNSSRGVISGNTFTGNAAGVMVTGSRNRITDNTLDGMSGTETLGLVGISVTGHDNLLADN